jgi:hypothetical protein
MEYGSVSVYLGLFLTEESFHLLGELEAEIFIRSFAEIQNLGERDDSRSMELDYDMLLAGLGPNRFRP